MQCRISEFVLSPMVSIFSLVICELHIFFFYFRLPSSSLFIKMKDINVTRRLDRFAFELSFSIAKGYRTLSVLLLTSNLRDKRRIHSFPSGD